MAKANITAERLHEVLHYDPSTGIFTWKVRLSYNVPAGRLAGSYKSGKYCFIRVDGVIYPAHRLAWFYMTGTWPKNDIDHKDTNPQNNAFNNLRDVTRQVNKQNRRSPQANNKTGILGVCFDKRVGRKNPWCMQIRLPDGTKMRSEHATPEEAHAAYLAAKRLHHEGNTL